jgi:predicted membrane chloride channel (bestrophin family)
MKLDPFELHPDVEPQEKKPNNILTLEQICDIIDIEIKEVEGLPPNPWGFTRDDIIEALEKVKEKIEK